MSSAKIEWFTSANIANLFVLKVDGKKVGFVQQVLVLNENDTAWRVYVKKGAKSGIVSLMPSLRRAKANCVATYQALVDCSK